MSQSKKSLFIWLTGLASLCIFSLPILWPATATAQFSPGEQRGLETLGRTAYKAEGQPRDIRLVIGGIIKAILSVIGFLLVTLMIIAGIQYMTATGNKTKIDSAISRIKNAFIGLIIILIAYAATAFILAKIAIIT